jgi:hypothetical protein
MKYEQKTKAPLWLEFSGLPQLLAEKVRGGIGWALFKKIVELDCEANPEPGTVEITLAELSARCGASPATAHKALLAMRRLKLVACFLPESEEEVALLRVRAPLQTPLSIDRIKAAHPRLFLDTPQYFRYVDEYQPEPEDSAADPDLQEIVDLYFNTVGVKMNAFILDELRLIRNRFPIDQVRRTFRRAIQNEIHSLHWVVKELIRLKKTSDEENPKND